VLALLQLVASTSVDVYNGRHPGWWVAIQGTTVAFAAAFAGAAAASNGAWWRRMQEKAGSTTPSSLGTGMAASAVAGAVFAVLCWAASSLGDAASPMALAVLLAALLGGVVGSVRVGGAVLAGLVATFVATLLNLVGQLVNAIFVIAPAVSRGQGAAGGSLAFSAVVWIISTVAGSLTGIWWLSRRRQHTWWAHATVVGLFPGVLLTAGSFGSFVAWLLVQDPDKDEALNDAIGAHGLQLGISLGCGLITTLLALRLVPDWRRRPVRTPVAATETAAAPADGGNAPVAETPGSTAESSRVSPVDGSAANGTSDTAASPTPAQAPAKAEPVAHTVDGSPQPVDRPGTTGRGPKPRRGAHRADNAKGARSTDAPPPRQTRESEGDASAIGGPTGAAVPVESVQPGSVQPGSVQAGSVQPGSVQPGSVQPEPISADAGATVGANAGAQRGHADKLIPAQPRRGGRTTRSGKGRRH
jgi:hypothetical protein